MKSWSRGRLLPRTVADASAVGRDALTARDIAEPGLEAAILLGHALGGRTRAWLLTHGGTIIGRTEVACYLALVARRCRREPSAYVTGVKHWLDMTFEVNRSVLIPRPETEQLAHDAVAIARTKTGASMATPTIVDVGTGSGAIAIALARACSNIEILAVDSSPGALRTARANANHMGSENVRFAEGCLLSPVSAPIDLLVANLPYVRSSDMAGLEPELAFEPRGALDGGVDGLDVIRALLHQARGRMAAGGYIVLECGMEQAGTIGQMAHAYWPSASVITRQDYSKRDRFVHIHLR